MSADSEEVFACYRFDGLERWTSRSVAAWHEDIEVVIGYARHALGETDDPELRQCLGAYASYLESDEFRHYVGALRAHLEELGGLALQRSAEGEALVARSRQPVARPA